MAARDCDNIRSVQKRVVLDKSSQISAVPYWVEVGREEPTDPLQVQIGWMNALMTASRESAVLNRWAAIWTAWDCCAGRSHDGS